MQDETSSKELLIKLLKTGSTPEGTNLIGHTQAFLIARGIPKGLLKRAEKLGVVKKISIRAEGFGGVLTFFGVECENPLTQKSE